VTLTLTLSTLWIQVHLMTIVCKFGRDPAICLREEAICAKVYRRRTPRHCISSFFEWANKMISAVFKQYLIISRKINTHFSRIGVVQLVLHEITTADRLLCYSSEDGIKHKQTGRCISTTQHQWNHLYNLHNYTQGRYCWATCPTCTVYTLNNANYIFKQRLMNSNNV